jgi:D-glycero-D-manno-heptose 1,7-bisphosphate phosphatase
VFFDRDGVLVQEIVRGGEPYAPTELDQFRVVPAAAAAVRRVRELGLACIVFTNQPEVATGLLSWATLEAMHDRLRTAVPLDDIFVCPHDDRVGCDCRKPRPGMLRAAAARWDVDLARSFVIGDRWRDVDAGRSVGAYSILLERPYSACSTADAAVGTLDDAVDLVLARARAP